MNNRLAGLRELAVAARLGGYIDDHGASLHALDRGARNNAWRATAGHRGSRDERIGQRYARIECFLLLALLRLAELARVTAAALRRHAGFDELRAERLDLLAGRTAHVIGFHYGAEAPRSRNRLQASNADADDQDLRGADRAGRGREHGQKAVQNVGRDQ